ncbi:CsgG/HfaB family protein [Kiritimatiellota bacterium B12222]|nr:CsgG/HfaB family protein [Kiritimatiellota bacterium B12222]
MKSKHILYPCALSLFFVWLTGCASTGESAQRDQTTANIANFSPPPSGTKKLVAAVPPFEMDDKNIYGYSVTGNELSTIAADQMTTLLFKTRRFDVIERAQLNQLLREQSLEGIVKDGELAQMGQIDGVDYLLLGKITNFRFKRESTSTDYGVAGRVSRELLDGITGGFSKDSTRITTEVGVDIRLVNPENGKILMAEFSEYERTDTADSMGIRVAGIGGGGDSNIQPGKDDAGQVLRLAFADALHKAMPQIDQIMIEQSRAEAAASAVAPASSTMAPAPASAPASAPATASKFCGNCGTPLGANSKFCSSCGTKVP